MAACAGTAGSGAWAEAARRSAAPRHGRAWRRPRRPPRDRIAGAARLVPMPARIGCTETELAAAYRQVWPAAAPMKAPAVPEGSGTAHTASGSIETAENWPRMKAAESHRRVGNRMRVERSRTEAETHREPASRKRAGSRMAVTAAATAGFPRRAPAGAGLTLKQAADRHSRWHTASPKKKTPNMTSPGMAPAPRHAHFCWRSRR
jgi:hypothetical protein